MSSTSRNAEDPATPLYAISNAHRIRSASFVLPDIVFLLLFDTSETWLCAAYEMVVGEVEKPLSSRCNNDM